MVKLKTLGLLGRVLARHPAMVVAWVCLAAPPVVRGSKDDAPQRVEDSRGGCRAVWTRSSVCGNGILDEDEVCDEGSDNRDPEEALPGECSRECKIQPGCGDGKIEAGEECDGGEWCSYDCKVLEECGNGVLEADEACDGADVPADKPGATCTETCALMWCGDGMVRPGEECDDGPMNGDEQACTAGCRINVCGDGKKGPGEGCDDGNTSETDGCPSGSIGRCMAPAECGDGLAWTGKEDCDDGNQIDDDACSNACTLPTCGDKLVQGDEQCDDGVETAQCNIDCSSVACGDGIINNAAGEVCDDGNQDYTDACLSDCTLPSCGDGFVWAGVEDCDDGNLDDLDECNNDCAAPRFVFLTSFLFSGNLSGVAGADNYCQGLAASEKLPGTYMAWLTDGDQVTEPAQRFSSNDFKGWYILPTKPPMRVARGWAELTTSNEAMPMDYLGAAITAVETGIVVNSANVWTNTNVDGTQASPDGHCSNWKSDLDPAIGWTGLAKPGALGAQWTVGDSYTCSFSLRIYCFGVAP